MTMADDAAVTTTTTNVTAPATAPSPAPVGRVAKTEALIARLDAADRGEPDTAVIPNEGGEPSKESSAASTTRSPTSEEVKATRYELMKQKLADQKARDHAKQLVREAKAYKAKQEEDARVHSAERAKWEAVGKDYNAGLKNLGLNPREVYEEMNRQANAVLTPEGREAAMQAALHAEIEKRVNPLQQTVEEMRLRAEQAEAAKAKLEEQHYITKVVNSFKEEVVHPDFIDIRTEYGDQAIFNYVRDVDENPQALIDAAARLNVPLSNPEVAFSIREVLMVIAAQRAAEIHEIAQRREKLLPPSPPGDKPEPRPTVNGTAPKRNADNTIGNDLAAARASSGGGKRLSHQENLDSLIARLDRRR